MVNPSQPKLQSDLGKNLKSLSPDSHVERAELALSHTAQEVKGHTHGKRLHLVGAQQGFITPQRLEEREVS